MSITTSNQPPVFPKPPALKSSNQEKAQQIGKESKGLIDNNIIAKTQVTSSKELQITSVVVKSKQESEISETLFKEATIDSAKIYEKFKGRPIQPANIVQSASTSQLSNVNMTFSSAQEIEKILGSLPAQASHKMFSFVDDKLILTNNLNEANLHIFEDKSGNFLPFINSNCDHQKVLIALQSEGHNFGIDSTKLLPAYIVPDHLWIPFQLQVATAFPEFGIANQNTVMESNELEGSAKASSSYRTLNDRKMISSFISEMAETQQRKLNKEEIIFLRGFLKDFRKNADTSSIKSEREKQQLDRDILRWTLQAYDLQKANIDRELKNKGLSKEKYIERVAKWQDSLPPFPLIVKTNAQLYRGDLKAKTLEMIATSFYQQQNEVKPKLAV